MAYTNDNGPGLAIPSLAPDKEWERKQRNKEYRVAARREKRNRKGDEKKQRKLNATILRRMTRNPHKYSKNAERNRLRDIELERRKIWQEAVKQAQRLAAIHDLSGKTFNVGAVFLQEDGSVISQETLRRREERARAKAAAEQANKHSNDLKNVLGNSLLEDPTPTHKSEVPLLEDGVNPDPLARIEAQDPQKPSRLSKTQMKKRAALEPLPAPPKPVIPQDVSIPEGEVNWAELWDLSDDQLERRVLQEKKRKAAERKALRVRQKSGKEERRIARDEKRKVYREIKLTWKNIKEKQVRERTKLKSMEEEESKKIAVDVNITERRAALDHCATLGFTLLNTPGVEDIKPRALGMKGAEIDFDSIEIDENRSHVRPKQNTKRVDLGNAPKDPKAEYIPSGRRDEDDGVKEFIKLDVGEGQEFETLDYNHKLRRKLRRAIDSAEIQKETLVRQRALDFYREKNIEAPAILKSSHKPKSVTGSRILENGSFETAKKERIEARLELARFNEQMRILRKQAKDAAIYAGLKKHAELMGRIPSDKLHIKGHEAEHSVQPSPEGRVSPPGNVSISQSSAGDNVGLKRSRSESSVSSADGDSQYDKSAEVSATSDESSDSRSSASYEDLRAKKRMKADASLSNNQEQSTNSDRRTMIDAERRLKTEKANTPRADRKPQDRLGKGTNSSSTWNVGSLNGDQKRKGKFLRLLGAEKVGSAVDKVDLENHGLKDDESALINTALERQFEYGVSQKQAARHRGLGA